jgi:flagellar assembly protein FliH
VGVQKKDGAGGSLLASALEDAQSIIAEAERRAAELVAQAEKTYQEARELGFQEGVRQGLAQTAGQAVRLIADSTTLAESLADEAARLALAISSSVIGEHVKVQPEAVKKIAMTAIQEAVVGDKVTIVINEEDEAALKGALEQLRRLAGGAGITLEVNNALSRGGCIVRTDFGEVDASVTALLESVAQRLGIDHG